MIKCGHCGESHERVAEVRACFAAQGGPEHHSSVVTADRPAEYPLATDAQVKFIRSLLNDRYSLHGSDVTWSTTLQESLGDGEPGDSFYRPRTLGKREASNAINRIKTWAQDRRPASGALPVATISATVTQDGIYRNPESGEIYKVQFNRASGSGKRLYAKQLVIRNGDWPGAGMDWEITQIPLTEGQARVIDGKAEWIYRPGAMLRIKPEWRMSLEQAKVFGVLYGRCIRCLRDLTNEESIEAAMGPVCRNKKNWG